MVSLYVEEMASGSLSTICKSGSGVCLKLYGEVRQIRENFQEGREIIQDKKAAVSYIINNAMIKKHRTSLFYFCTRYIFIGLTVKRMNDSVIARSGQYDAV